MLLLFARSFLVLSAFVITVWVFELLDELDFVLLAKHQPENEKTTVLL